MTFRIKRNYLQNIQYQLHTNILIYTYIFDNNLNWLKTTISHRSLRISDLLLLYFFFYLAFLIDIHIIDNIITYSLYIITSAELPPMAVCSILFTGGDT